MKIQADYSIIKKKRYYLNTETFTE